MNRRGFLSSLLTGTAALTLDPERLLWVPGKKTIFVSPAPVGTTVTVDDLWRAFEKLNSAASDVFVYGTGTAFLTKGEEGALEQYWERRAARRLQV